MKGKIKALFQKLLEKLGLKEKSFVNYISQGNSLPSPLTPDEEAETVRKYLAGDEEARLSLIEHNLRLVVYIAKRFDNTGVDMDDVLLVNMLEAYGIPCLKNYPGDGQFGKIMLGMSGYGVEILVPETLLADAQALQEGCAEALTEGDDNA